MAPNAYFTYSIPTLLAAGAARAQGQATVEECVSHSPNSGGPMDFQLGSTLCMPYVSVPWTTDPTKTAMLIVRAGMVAYDFARFDASALAWMEGLSLSGHLPSGHTLW